MTEHSPDQEPRLLEGSSGDQRRVTLEVVGGTVASGNVAYATERIEQLCPHRTERRQLGLRHRKPNRTAQGSSPRSAASFASQFGQPVIRQASQTRDS